MIKTKAKSGDYGRCSCLSAKAFKAGDRVIYVYGSREWLGRIGIVSSIDTYLDLIYVDYGQGSNPTRSQRLMKLS